MITAAPLQNTAAQSAPVSNFSHAGLLLQRKCACGGPTPSSLSGECEECRNKRLQTKLRIGASNDPLEQEADRVADAVVSGTPMMGLNLSKINIASVQRQDSAKPKSNEDKYKEAAPKIGEAFLETELGKKLKEQVEHDPLVKGAESFIGTLPGKIITGAAAVGTVAMLAATHKELPAQIPEIPLDMITPGLKVQITYEGSVDNPSKAMITFSYTEQLSGDKKPAKSRADLQHEENARMAMEMAKFRADMHYKPGTPEAKRQESEETALKRAAFSGIGKLPDYGNVKTFPPLAPAPSALSMQFPTPSYGFKPKPFSLMDEELKLKPRSEASEGQDQEKKKKEEGAPIQRKAAGDSTPDAAPSLVDDVLAVPGRPLDAATRGFMETRFGHDFSQVRVHSGAIAEQSARDVNACAYTVGNNVVFGAGQFAPESHAGQKLLAHELTHVVQQDQAMLRRQSLGELDDSDAAAEREYGDKGAPKALSCGRPSWCPAGFCSPYSSAPLAEYYRGKNAPWLLAGIAAAVDSRVVPLWREYLWGGSPAKNLSQTFGSDFTKSPTTRKTTEYLYNEVKASLAAAPPFVPMFSNNFFDLKVLIPIAISALGDPVSPNQMNFNVPKDIPGNIAGGIGVDQLVCPAGAQPSPFNDERHAHGMVNVARTSEKEIVVMPSISYTVKDTIDLCPGDCGTFLEQVATVSLSQFEATGISGDVPFIVDFPAPSLGAFTIHTPLSKP